MCDCEASACEDLSEARGHRGRNTEERMFHRKEASPNAKLSDGAALGTCKLMGVAFSSFLLFRKVSAIVEYSYF